MSDNKSNFISDNSDTSSTDPIMDLKVGIYNLFVNLVNNSIVYYGPEQAVKMSIDYLQEIIYNFEQAIKPNEEQ
jgi:hypothetical protein